MTDTEKIAPITAEERVLACEHAGTDYREWSGHNVSWYASRILAYESALTAAEAEIERLKKHVVRLRAFIKADHILARAESAERRIAAVREVPKRIRYRHNYAPCSRECALLIMEEMEHLINAALDAKEQS